MAIFKYRALDKTNKKISGLVEAVNEEAAAGILNEQDLSIISIKQQAKAKEIKLLAFLNRVKARDLVIFSRQFSVMISANVSLVQALKIFVKQTNNPTLKTIISEISDEVDAGSRLSDALAKRPKVFSDFYINVIKSGESSGKLDEVLNYLADEMEQDYDMMSKIKGAMIYPAFVLTGLGIVGAVMMIFVIPKLTDIMSGAGAELPLATKILIAVSNTLANYWWLIIITILAVIIGLKLYVKTSQGRKLIHFIILKIPIFGKLLQRIHLVRFTRSMNTLIIGGVTINKSLEIASKVVTNQTYRNLINKTAEAVEAGESISSEFVKSKEIPSMVTQMLSIGEKTGKLDIILSRITDFYSREINNIIANLMTLMEPIIMVIMGVAVGIMVAAVILPMYNLANQF